MPLIDDEDDKSSGNGKDAHERFAERKKKAEDAEKVAVSPEDEEAPRIDVTERDDEDDDDVTEDKQERPSRKERRKNRYREAMERAEAAERRAEQAEQQARQAFMISQQQALTQKPAESSKDEFKEKLDAVYREQEMLYRELNMKGQNIRPDEVERIEQRARELDEMKHEIIAQRLRKKEPGQAQGAPTGDMVTAAMIQMEYPDVCDNPQVLAWAQSYYGMLRAEGRPGTLVELREAMEKARQRYRLPTAKNGRKPPPSPVSRSRYEGFSRGQAGATEEPEQEVVMSKAFRKMANAMYPHVKEEKKRFEMWAKGAGKRALRSQREKHAG